MSLLEHSRGQQPPAWYSKTAHHAGFPEPRGKFISMSEAPNNPKLCGICSSCIGIHSQAACLQRSRFDGPVMWPFLLPHHLNIFPWIPDQMHFCALSSSPSQSLGNSKLLSPVSPLRCQRKPELDKSQNNGNKFCCKDEEKSQNRVGLHSEYIRDKWGCRSNEQGTRVYKILWGSFETLSLSLTSCPPLPPFLSLSLPHLLSHSVTPIPCMCVRDSSVCGMGLWLNQPTRILWKSPLRWSYAQPWVRGENFDQLLMVINE